VENQLGHAWQIYSANPAKQAIDDFNIVLVADLAAAFAAVAELEACPVLGIDIETAATDEYQEDSKAGLDPYKSHIRLVQAYGGGPNVFVFDMAKISVSEIRPLMACPLIAHNALFELKFFLHARLNPGLIGCTMLAGQVLTGQLSSLRVVAKELLTWALDKTLQTSDWSQAELTDEQVHYAAVDAVAAYRIWEIQRQLLAKQGLTRAYTLMRDAQHAVAKLELNGILFDRDLHQELMAAWQRDKDLAAVQLKMLLGPELNPSSNKQLGEWLSSHLDSNTVASWPRTPTGQVKVDVDALNRCKNHPVIQPLLRYKKATKALSTYGDQYAAHIHPVTGRIHASFRLGGAITGRMSCSRPNIQNPPNGEFRKLFTSPPGRTLVVADFGQIELRVAALIAADKAMLSAYEKGEDLHAKTAAAVLGVAITSVTKAQRQLAKAVNFGLLYGQGAKGLVRYASTAYGVDMTQEQAQAARRSFFLAYPGLAAWQGRQSKESERTGKAVTPAGRVRDFRREPKGCRYTEALNTPISGGAAEVLMATLAVLDQHLGKLDAKLVNVVHDELVLEVARDDEEGAKRAVEEAMLAGYSAIFPDAERTTRNLAEASSGSNWASAKR